MEPNTLKLVVFNVPRNAFTMSFDLFFAAHEVIYV